MKKIIVLILLCFTIYGCSKVVSCSEIIGQFAPKKKGILSNKKEFLEADKYFWDNFHAGNVDSIPQMLEKLTAVYLKNNRDYRIAAHIGFVHTWAINTSRSSPRVTDHATLAVKYFKEAFDMHPEKEWRYYGFYVAMYMSENAIHGNMQKMTDGYLQMKKAVRKYPEFNLFTAAYTLSSSPRKKDRDAALDLLWENLDKCLDEKVDRKNLDYRKYMDKIDLKSKKSTCWNSWIAPHNVEGFLLILGDLLLKKGDYETALIVYQNAKYFKEYDQWDYKSHLEQRIKETKDAIKLKKDYSEMKLLSFDRCMICHQDKEMILAPEDVHLKMPPMEKIFE